MAKSFEEQLDDHGRQVPDSAEGWLETAEEFMNTNEPSLAVECLTRAIQLGAGTAAVYHDRSIQRSELDRMNEALSDIEEAIVLEPDSPDHHRWKGVLLLEVKRYEEAMAAFERSLQLKDDTEARNDLAKCYVGLNEIDKALELMAQNIAQEPDSHWLYGARAQLYQDLNRLDEAIQDITEAIRCDPKPAKAYACRGELRHKNRDLRGAEADYQRALSLNPDDLHTQALLNRVSQENTN